MMRIHRTLKMNILFFFIIILKEEERDYERKDISKVGHDVNTFNSYVPKCVR